MTSTIKLEITLETKGDQSALSADNIIDKFINLKNSACIVDAKLTSINISQSANTFIRLINFGKSLLPKEVQLRRRYSRDDMIAYYTNVNYTHEYIHTAGITKYNAQLSIDIYTDKLIIHGNEPITFNYADPNIKSQVEEYFKNLK